MLAMMVFTSKTLDALLEIMEVMSRYGVDVYALTTEHPIVGLVAKPEVWRKHWAEVLLYSKDLKGYSYHRSIHLWTTWLQIQLDQILSEKDRQGYGGQGHGRHNALRD
jgi:hypothetical protein